MVKIQFLLFAFFLVTFSQIYAATYYSLADGDWTDPIWSTNPNDLPASGVSLPNNISGGNITNNNEVVIRHTVTNESNIQINNGGTITVADGGYFEVNNVNMNNGSSLVVESGGTLEAGSIDNKGGIITNGGTIITDDCTGINGTCVNEPLPIELISFTANPQGKSVLLSWATASELNNDYFTVEKSRNGKEFEVLTKVDGNGTTHVRTDYQYFDQNLFLGLSYYRLRQTDYDGTSETFPAVSVLFTASDQFSVFPNPIKDQTLGIKISGRQKNEILELNMFNLQGRLILKQQFVADALGYLDTTIDVGQQLDKGAYILELVSATGKEHIKVQYE